MLAPWLTLHRWHVEHAAKHDTPLLRLRPEASAGQPAVDDERVTIHEARFVARQPQRRVSDVLGQSGPANRLQRLEAALHERDRRAGWAGREPEGLAEDRRREAAGTDAVAPHATLAELHRDGAGQVDDGRLGGAVDVGPETGAEPGHARRADDRARSLPLHHGRRMLHPEEDAAQQHADGRVEAVDADLVDPTVDASCASVVEEAVESAEATNGLVDHCRDVGLAAHVGVDVRGASADVGRDFPAAIVLDVRRHDRGSLVDEEANGGFTDAARTPGDERDLALQPLHARDPAADSRALALISGSGRGPAVAARRRP